MMIESATFSSSNFPKNIQPLGFPLFFIFLVSKYLLTLSGIYLLFIYILTYLFARKSSLRLLQTRKTKQRGGSDVPDY